MNKEARKQQKINKNRQDIIDAALKVFITKGFEKATIAEIASEADFSVGTIYNFFTSKKELFDAIFDSHVVFLLENFNKIFSQSINPLEKIVIQLHSMFDIFSDKIDLLKFWYDTTGLPISTSHNSLSTGIVELKKTVTKKGIDCFAEAIKLGMIQNINPKYLNLALDGIVYSYIRAYIEEPENYSLQELLKNIKKIYFQSITTEKGDLALIEANSKVRKK